MALSDSLEAYYSFEENFDEEIYAVNSVPPNAHSLTDAFALSPIVGIPTLMQVHSVAGRVGLAAEFTGAVSSMHSADASVFRFPAADEKTFTLWFKYYTLENASNSIISKSGEYTVRISQSTRKLVINGFLGTVILHPDVLVANQWYFLVFWRDPVSGLCYAKLNDGVPASAVITSIQANNNFLVGGDTTSFDGVLDEMGIWSRILTAEEMTELYNGGEGMSYDEIAPVARQCREVDCCEDDLSQYVSDTGEGLGFSSNCDPTPIVSFEPASGSTVIFPTLVTLRTNNPSATIYYTTDGSAPDSNASVYSSPFSVDSPGTVVRAIGIVPGCDPGVESNAQFQTWTPAAAFTYACTTTDRSGQWAGFAANGNPDYNWELQIQFTAATGVVHFDILQLDSSGEFTGAAWSTKEFIYPWESDQTLAHRAFPLVIWIGGVQQNFAYLDNYSATLGNFGIGAHTLDMHGEPWWTLANSFFKLIVTFADGSTVTKIVDNTCDALPAALCPVPVFTLTPACAPFRIDVVFTTTIGREYIIYRRVAGSAAIYDLLANANAVSSPQTFQDLTVVAGEQYEYLFAHKPPLCIDFVFAPLQLATAIADPVVAIGSFPETINQGASSTISWDSLEISGNVTISPTIGAQPGNLAGSQSVSPATTTVYTITGSNACGTSVQAQTTVTVIVAATCGAVQPLVVGIEHYIDLSLFNAIIACPNLDFGGVVTWHGRFEQTVGCTFQTPDFPFNFGTSPFGGGGRLLDVANTNITINGGVWTLRVSGYIGGVPTDVWTGTKAFGDTPIGRFDRVSGCSTRNFFNIIDLS